MTGMIKVVSSNPWTSFGKIFRMKKVDCSSAFCQLYCHSGDSV